VREKIVVVEDEPDILELLSYSLEKEHFSVESSNNGPQGLELIQNIIPDMVLLDLMLPGMDGMEVCYRLKSNKLTQHIPIIMISAKDSESDIVLGLGIGADDYVTKPFSTRELIARVKTVLRSKNAKKTYLQDDRIIVEGLEIDPNRFQVLLNNKKLQFTTAEFRLLHYLASNPGLVFTRKHLIEQALRHGGIVVDRNIDVHIQSIRSKINGNQHYIETVRGIGYRFKSANQLNEAVSRNSS